MTISIIIPIYNVAPYVEKCINSVISQTYQGEMECILVDDCGTDNSIDLCERMLSSYKGRIHFRIVHREKNGGLSAARNTGLDIAVGTYIYFIDSDDWIDPRTIEVLVDAMEKGYDVIGFNYSFFGEKNGDCRFSYIEKRFKNENDKIAFLYRDILRFNHGWSAWSRCYRKSIIDKYHLRFVDNHYIFAEDLCFFLCYMMAAKNYLHISNNLYHYLIRGGSLMNGGNADGNIIKYVHLAFSVNSFITKNHILPKKLLRYFPLLFWGIFRHCNRVAKCPINAADIRVKEGIYLRYWLTKAGHNLYSLRILSFYEWLEDNIFLYHIFKNNRRLYVIDACLFHTLLFVHKLFLR